MCSQPKHLSDMPQCKNVGICVLWGRCSVLGAGPEWDLSACLDTWRLPLSKNHFQTKGRQLPGILVVISRLNNLPMSCWNAKKTSYKTTNVSYLFPFGASQQKQNNIIRTYVEFLRSQQQLSNSGVKSKHSPFPFMKMGLSAPHLFLIQLPSSFRACLS